ncbi:major facilitator superfamily domain-containing protein [Lipomyces oligophaga]|uniref:major facilitator superfamily domain-containing protein n=1 Tax=Lipomyces oligophaga TaxID=45792 RepID=UPI0034CDFFC5
MADSINESVDHEASRLLSEYSEPHDIEELNDASKSVNGTTASRTAGKPPFRSLILVFVTIYVGMFLGSLDGTIVATLLSRIASDFNELRSVSWIATSYLIAEAAVQPLYGKFSDIFGRKPLIIVSYIFFAIGAVICGIAPSLWFLVFGRVISGIGGGGLMTLTAVTLSDLVSLRQRGILQGIGNMVYMLGAAFGGIVGGILAETVGWRWTFLMQGPIAVLSIVAIHYSLHLPQKTQDSNLLGRIDFLGSSTLLIGLVMFLYSVSVGGSYFPWSSAVVVMPLTGSVIVLSIFVYIELFVAVEPVLPLSLLRVRSVLGATLTGFFMTMVYFGHLFYLAIYMQSVRNKSATTSGSSLIPMFIGNTFGSLGCGLYMKSTGKYRFLCYAAMAGLFTGSVGLSTIGIDTPAFLAEPYLFLSGVGGGLYLTITLVGLIASVPQEYQAIVTSIQFGFRGIGSTVGVAVAAALFQNALAARLHQRIIGPGSEEIIRLVQDSVEEIKNIPESYRHDVTLCYLDAIHAVFILTAVLSIFAGLSSLLMKEHSLSDSVDRDDEDLDQEDSLA